MNHCDVEGFRNEIKAIRNKGKDEFFTWMDGGEDVDGAFEKAEDVFNRLMLPSAKKHLKKLNKKTSLDIGYGSGGQVLVASMYFDKSYGLDVHEERDFVLDELSARGGKLEDIQLLIGDGYVIPLEEDSVDFVHSWVTFMHLGTADATNEYLAEMFRVMRPGGVAVVYFSRMMRSQREQVWSEVQADINLEKDGPGYREGGPLTRVRGINIQMSMWYMEELATSEGFEVLDHTASWGSIKRRRYFFGQYGIVFRKPAARKLSTSSKSVASTDVKSTPSKSRVRRRVDKSAV